MIDADRHAQRLLRCYPRVWRDRYGDELGALLADDRAERARCWRRDLNVIRAGLVARLSACGLSGGPVRDGSSATAVAAVASVFFAAGALSIWTQLADGWLSAPHERVATASLVAMSVWLAGLLLTSIAFGIRLAVAVLSRLRSGAGHFLRGALSTLTASGALLVVGVNLVAASAPGARGPHRHGVLAHAAPISWAATQTISTFWLHPQRLLALPATDIAWMVICPAAVAAAGWSLLRLVRLVRGTAGHTAPRLDWHAPWVANVVFPPCLAGAALWVVGSQHAENLNYRAGSLDLFLIAMMATASYAVRRCNDNTMTGW